MPAIAPAPAAQAAPGSAAQAAPAPPRRAQQPAQRPRPSDPRDRAWMDGGMPGGGFSGFGATVTAPRPELAPRPNRDIEAPRPTTRPPQPGEAAIAPTIIHPRLPGNSPVQDGGATMRENRFLREPAPGQRMTAPLAW